ncbi:MAG: M56 family metallopeptidase [Candidatus Sulfotelmatobacter sp.]|jgi:beta-lactamase regulating signal transducer with metallopeptidase domain
MALTGHWQALAEILAGRVLNSTAEGIVIALFIWIMLLALRRQNSSTRFAMWFSGMAAIALLPIVESVGSHPTSAAAMASHFTFRLPASWAMDAFAVWVVIAGIGLAKIGMSFWQLGRLRQSCAPINSATLHPLLRETLNEFGSARRVTLCTSDRVRVPTAIGFLKPAVVIPAWALEELSPVELNAILLHELAHLRRWDDWTNLAQRILSALLFFHPAIWWIGDRLSREREMACDDFVLAATSNPRGYAQCLVTVAEKSFLRRSVALAQAAVGRMQQTAHRVARILDADRSTTTKVWKPALGLVSAISVACLISMPRMPRFVAFDSSKPGFSESASRQTPTLANNAASIGARIIPASLHVSGGTVRRHDSLARTVKVQSRKHGELSVAAVTRTKVAQPQTRMVNASANSSRDDVSEPNSVLLVMHTQQIDEYGQVWNICVWSLTVFHPVDREVHKAITPKST